MLVTCATIMQSFMLMVTMPLGGITGGTQSILGFNYGARRPDRVLEAQKYIVLLCLLFTTVFFLVAQLIPQVFVLIFTRDPEYVAMASRAIRIFTLGIIPLGIQYTIVDGFTGMGVVRASLPLSFWRKGLYFVSLFVLPALFGAQAVFFTGPIADFGGTAVSVAVYLLYLAWKIATASGADASFSQPVSLLIGGVFAAAALAFGWYTWRRYRADLKEAQLTPEEEEELRREREMEP